MAAVALAAALEYMCAEIIEIAGNACRDMQRDSDAGASAKMAGSGKAGAKDEPPVPPGWVATLDPSSGRTYYYNQSTRITTWTLPDSAGVARHDALAARGQAKAAAESGERETRKGCIKAAHIKMAVESDLELQPLVVTDFGFAFDGVVRRHLP